MHAKTLSQVGHKCHADLPARHRLSDCGSVPGERHHTAARDLVEAGRAGRVKLLTATSVEYDFERRSSRAPRRKAQVAFGGDPSSSRRAGAVTFDMSPRRSGRCARVGPSEGIADGAHEGPGDHAGPADRTTAGGASSSTCTMPARLLWQVDALVTIDEDDLLDKSAAIFNACGLAGREPRKHAGPTGLTRLSVSRLPKVRQPSRPRPTPPSSQRRAKGARSDRVKLVEE